MAKLDFIDSLACAFQEWNYAFMIKHSFSYDLCQMDIALFISTLYYEIDMVLCSPYLLLSLLVLPPQLILLCLENEIHTFNEIGNYEL